MEWLHRVLLRMKMLTRRRDLERDLEDELAFHLTLREEKQRAEEGGGPDARAAARRKFGNVTSLKERCREMWTFASFETLCQDVRYSARMLRKSPGFTAVALITLALGIGANAAIFSLVDSLYLRYLPVPDAARLVNVYQTREGRSRTSPMSLPDYLYYRDHNHVFSELAAHYSNAPINLVTGGESKEINGSVVTANFFHLLGVTPALGRFFLPEEDQVRDRDAVAVISYELWQRQFGSSAQILGKTMRLNGATFIIVGVAPRDFHGVSPGGLATEVWIPSAMFRTGYRYCDAYVRDCTVVDLIGGLRPDRTLADAQAEMNVLALQLASSYAETNRGCGAVVLPARGAVQHESDESVRITTLLAAAVGLVLLIACANLAGLLLARSTTRRKEIAVRLTLGASRARLVRQLLTETVMLALLGGALGLIVAFWASDLIQGFYAVNSEGQRAYFTVGLDPAVLWFICGLTLLTGVLFGLVPALQASRADLVPSLRGEGRSSGSRPSRLRDVLIVAQVALSIVLLVGAGLLVRSLRSVYRGAGWDPAQVVLLRLRPALVAYSPAKAAAFQREVVRRLEALPGVEAASPAFYPPLPGWDRHYVAAWLPGQEPARPGDGLQASYNIVGPQYFQTLGVPLLEGRDFDQRDRKGTPLVVLVNETLARRLWPGQSSVGRSMILDRQQYAVVGVVKDTQYLNDAQRAQPFVYFNYWQQDDLYVAPADSRTHVRVAGDAHVMLQRIRKEIAEIDPGVPISEDRPLTEWLNYTFQPVRVASTLLLCFSALAILLSAIGLYGVLAFSVSQRTREIGIRMALGAEPGNVARLVVRQGAFLAVLGVGVGLLGAFASARLLASLLYGVKHYDLLTFCAGPAVLVSVALLASYLPARRAMRVDPMVALRHE